MNLLLFEDKCCFDIIRQREKAHVCTHTNSTRSVHTYTRTYSRTVEGGKTDTKDEMEEMERCWRARKFAGGFSCTISLLI